jgi:hypothetical protein
MALPTIVKTWVQALTTGTPGKTITYSSLIDLSQQTAYGWKTLLLANGYTHKWSASGGTGPTNSADTTDRVTSAAAFTPRATSGAASQGWYLLTDGNAGQLLVSFTGATDNAFRVAYSPTGAYVLAGTTTNIPTATDEILVTAATGSDMVGTTTSGNRVWHALIASDFKSCRFWMFRSSVLVGLVWGVEEYTTSAVAPMVVSPAVWVFSFTPANLVAGTLLSAFSAAARGGITRVVYSGTPVLAQVSVGTEYAGGSTVLSTYTYKPEMQGGSNYTPYTLALHSGTASARGRVGNPIDWWAVNPSGVADGDGFGTSYQFTHLGCVIWPNPSAVQPTIA